MIADPNTERGEAGGLAACVGFLSRGAGGRAAGADGVVSHR
jgi:hypothetical protein